MPHTYCHSYIFIFYNFYIGFELLKLKKKMWRKYFEKEKMNKIELLLHTFFFLIYFFSTYIFTNLIFKYNLNKENFLVHRSKIISHFICSSLVRSLVPSPSHDTVSPHSHANQQTCRIPCFWAHGTLDTRHRTRSSNEPSNHHKGFHATRIAVSFLHDKSTSSNMDTLSRTLLVYTALHLLHMMLILCLQSLQSVQK